MRLTRDQIRKQLEGELRLCQSILLISYRDAVDEYKGEGIPGAIAWFESDDEYVYSFVHIIGCLYGVDSCVKPYRQRFLASAERGVKMSLPRVKRRMNRVCQKKQDEPGEDLQEV